MFRGRMPVALVARKAKDSGKKAYRTEVVVLDITLLSLNENGSSGNGTAANRNRAAALRPRVQTTWMTTMVSASPMPTCHFEWTEKLLSTLQRHNNLAPGPAESS
jgi:hypothetical protein